MNKIDLNQIKANYLQYYVKIIQNIVFGVKTC